MGGWFLILNQDGALRRRRRQLNFYDTNERTRAATIGSRENKRNRATPAVSALRVGAGHAIADET
jgi:hypothetical protein